LVLFAVGLVAVFVTAVRLDPYDENWDGCHHVVPAPHPAHGFVGNELAVLLAPAAESHGRVGLGPCNLGRPDDYRVPDGGYQRALPDTVFMPTTAIVVEVVSPDDETFRQVRLLRGARCRRAADRRSPIQRSGPSGGSPWPRRQLRRGGGQRCPRRAGGGAHLGHRLALNPAGQGRWPTASLRSRAPEVVA